jgi:hypothetical protein
MWAELGGYDEKFLSPGGGLVNLDTYKRACNLDNSQLIWILGEGTFHQFHGGVAANAKVSPIDQFMEEYIRLRGYPFTAPDNVPWYFGRVSRHVWQSIRESVKD